MKTGLFYPNKEGISEINSVKITQEAFYKMNLYASIVSEIIGSNKECGGELLNYQDKYDNLVRDVGLWNQKVSSIDAVPSQNICEYERQNLKDVGIWHSHGGLSVFHSSTDVDTLKRLYKGTINKVPVHDSKKSLEYVLDGLEAVKVVIPEGDGQELVIEGDIKGIKYVKREGDGTYVSDVVTYLNRRVFNSIVINKNSYSEGYSDPRLNHDYDAEIWEGHSKDEPTRKEHVQLEVVDEKNNIRLDEEELVKEVGGKVRFQNYYLKDLPNYQKVLEKYKSIKNQNKCIEQIVNTEEQPEEKHDITDIVQNQAAESFNQEIEHNQELQGTKTYMGRLEEFYDTLNSRNDATDKAISELCRAYSGKQDWLWTKRFEKGNEILKKLKKNLTLEQKNTLESIKSIIESNRYLKRNHSLMFDDLQRRLDYKNNNSYNRLGGVVKKVAKYAGIAALAAALIFFPAKYASKIIFQPNKPATVYTVKKGDNLWNLTKDYLKNHGIRLDDKTVYKAVDKVADENGKGKQAEYKIGGKEKKNPHLIKPGQKITFSKNVLEHVKKGGKK
jgi:LysM repeat protein/proteasome lid subunit RPN8/RPN11